MTAIASQLWPYAEAGSEITGQALAQFVLARESIDIATGQADVF